MERENSITKRIGRVEVTRIEDGKLVRKQVYLGSRTTGEPHALVTKRNLADKPTDWTVDEFVNMTALARLFPRWSDGGNHFNHDTVFHPETLALVELRQCEVVLGTVESELEAA